MKVRRLLIGAALTAVVLVGCDSYNDKRGIGDAPVGSSQDGPAEVINFPDQFANVASKCDGHGHRIYSTTRDAAVTVIDDASCPGGRAS